MRLKMEWELWKSLLMFIGFSSLHIAAAHRIGYWQKSRRMCKISRLFLAIMFFMFKKSKVNIWVLIAQIVNISLFILCVILDSASQNISGIIKAISIYPVLVIYAFMAIDILFIDNSNEFV
jgi:hypothetical protein